MLEIICFLLVGVCAGLLSGLFGIGGGIVMVPAIVFILKQHPAFQTVSVMPIAASTSLFIMMMTAASSANAYRRRGALMWPIFWKTVPGLCLGLVSGTLLSYAVGHQTIINLFVFFLCLIAIHLWFDTQRKQKNVSVRPYPAHLTWQQQTILLVGSFCVGNLSTLFGIGGGILLVPLFLLLNGTLQQAAGTAALCGFVSALIGTLCLAYLPQQNLSLPHMIGQIYWPAAVLIGLASVVCAPWGTYLAFYLKTSLLKRLFSAIVLLCAWSLLQIG